MKAVRILCISDHVDPLIYSQGIRKRYGNVDLVISAGDLDLSYYGFIVSSLNKKLLFVFGNHNLKEISNYRKEYRHLRNHIPSLGIMENSYGSTYIGDRLVKEHGLIIAGLGGSYSYNGGRNQFTEVQMFFKILKLLPQMVFNRIFLGRWLDILVTHAPPKGINDGDDRCHRGFWVFRLFLRLFKPRYHLHGHVHLYDLNAEREKTFCRTRVINIYNQYMLEVKQPDVR